jgi:hypothetical protein
MMMALGTFWLVCEITELGGQMFTEFFTACEDL